MKIVHPDLKHQIVFKEEKIQILVVEKPELLYEYIGDLYAQCNESRDGVFVLSEEDKVVDFEKTAFMIMNPFELNVNSRRVLSKLYAQMKDIAVGEELYVETSQMMTYLENYLEKLADEVEYPLEFASEFDVTGLFKYANIQLQMNYECLLDKVLDYMEVMQKILGLQVCIGINMRAYFSEEELHQLYQMLEYRKISLLFVENHCPEKKMEEEEMFIVDSTGCEIY